MLNRVMLIGNLGADPELRYMPNGGAVATINVATTRNWKAKNGEKQSETEWHRVTFFQRLAEVAGEYLKKGSKVYIEGRIKTDQYEKDGQTVYRTGIIGESMQMLSSKSDGGQQGSQQATQQSRPEQAQQSQAPQQSGSPYDAFDDDIPF